MRITITNDQGEVYSAGPVVKNERGRWWFTDEDGDLLMINELLDAASDWAEVRDDALKIQTCPVCSGGHDRDHHESATSNA